MHRPMRPAARRVRLTHAALVIVSCVALAACGGDETPGDATGASAEISAAATNTSVASGPGASEPSGPDSTEAATTVPDTTSATSATSATSETMPTTEAAPLPPMRPIGAIDGAGDAVVVVDGVPTEVYDGTDPDDPAPEEGERVVVDGVTVTADAGDVVVSLCCEPVPGNLVRATPGSDPTGVGFGHLATFSPDGSLVWTAYGPINIGGADGTIATELTAFAPEAGRVIDLAVVPRDSTESPDVLVLVAQPDGTWLHRLSLAGGDAMSSTQVSTATWVDPTLPSLAGWRNDAFYVLERDDNELLAFDATTLAPVESGIVDEPDWESAWFTPDSTVLVTKLRQLMVNGDMVPGEYVWAR